MVLKDVGGKNVIGKITTNHFVSGSYRIPVLVVNGEAYGTFDVIGWQLVMATDREQAALKKAGYTIPEAEW